MFITRAVFNRFSLFAARACARIFFENRRGDAVLRLTRTHARYRVAIRVANFSRGYTIALLLLVAVKENGFLQVKRDRRFITANPLQRRGGYDVERTHKRRKVSKRAVPQDRLVKLE